ncbi:MAG: type II toxin-antitoxin system HicA family toxin, partial [Acidimicrobiia bacterium]
METEGWELLRDATGGVGHHYTYRLDTGEDVLRTRISHPPSAKATYGPQMWKAILRDQLKVSEEEFWACVRDRKVPHRSSSDQPDRGDGPPPEVVALLVNRVGLSDDDVRAMTRDEAIERLNAFWAR